MKIQTNLKQSFFWIVRSIIIIACTIVINATTQAQEYSIGHTTIEFYDFVRGRSIQTEIYYPSDNSGEDVPVAEGSFPVIAFGHGFVMDWNSYQSYWNEIVPEGYIFCFPTTEMSMNPNHEDFGFDLKFVANQMQIENNNNGSLFFNSISANTAIMGHSMGGGASFLAVENDTVFSTIVNFASAETIPSAIEAASNITIPALIFSGSDDCVTPTEENQELMYDALSSDCKTIVNIIDGGHCYFADYNFSCTLGETLCNPALNITREEQLSITFDFLVLWLDYSLKNNQEAFDVFNDSLNSSSRIDYLQFCNPTNITENNDHCNLQLFPNPVKDRVNLSICCDNRAVGFVSIYNIWGEKVVEQNVDVNQIQVDVSTLSTGTYFLVYSGLNSTYSQKFQKTQ